MFNFEQEPEQKAFEIVPVGEYEVYVESAEERPTSKGRMQLSVKLRIRDDVPQACQNRILFLNIFQKTPEKLTDADRQVGNYNYSHLYHLLDVSGIFASGKEFESMDDICRLLAGCELRVTVHHETWNGSPSAKIDQLKGVHESDPIEIIPNKQPQSPAYEPAKKFSAPPAPSASLGNLNDFQTIIDDDDVPF